MLGIDPRALRAAWTVLLLALVVAAAYAVRTTIAVFMIAVLFAYLLIPLVDAVNHYTPRRVSGTLALAIVYLMLVGFIVALGLTVGSRIADEANSLAVRLPDLLKNREWIDKIPLPYWLEPARVRMVQWLQEEIDTGGKDILPYVKSFGGQLITGARYVLYIILVPILAFFFLKDGRKIRRDVLDSLDENNQLVVEEILDDINRLLGQYIRALVLLAVSSFIANSVFLGLTGAPYAILLAVISALGEFLPVVGPAAGAVIVLAVTGLSGYTHLITFILFWILFRMFQDYVVNPYVMGKGVELNPLLVLFGVLAGEQMAGVAGMFFSVPVIATLRVVFVRLQRARTREIVTSKVQA
ncbi:MAG TPA: AI-2E family transporter [Bryobacteraceae bacterium]|jgi:predicted PurR-regulated permease PerM|nr:AI-2E family transporter [Bryobacteraceae bacterium]